MTTAAPGGDVRGFYEALGVELPGWAHTEAPARCFADPEAHQRQDRDASCSVNLQSGAFNCHGCGAHGGAYDAALAKGKSPRDAIDLMVAYGLTERRAPHAGGDRPPARARGSSSATAAERPVRPGTPERAESEALRRRGRRLRERSARLRESVALLRQDRKLLERLRAERGWNPATLRELGVGFDGERITVPITDAQHRLQGLLRLRIDDSQGPKVLAAPGTRLGLIPHPELEARRSVMLVEGPSDMLAARSAGLAAIAVPGTHAWRTEWSGELADRRVTVVLDCDRPGREAAVRIAGDLEHQGVHVRILELAPGRDDGYDLSDWLKDGNDQRRMLSARTHTTEQYRRIVEAAHRERAAAAGPTAVRSSPSSAEAAAAVAGVEGRGYGCARF